MNKHIGIQLRSLNNLIMRYIENSPEKKAMDRVTGTNGWIIGYIDENRHRDIFQKDLEEQFGITRSTASKVVGLMVQKGFIRHESVSWDARLKKLVLTEQAQQAVLIMKNHTHRIESVLTKGFTADELHTLQSYLCRISDNLK